MTMKKAIALFIAGVLFLASTLPALAAGRSSSALPGGMAVIDGETRRRAYLDIEEEKANVEAKILLARNSLIFQQSWVADGYEGAIGNVLTGEETPLPKFSTLFPGWDVPNDDVTAAMKRADITGWTPAEISRYAHMDIGEAKAAVERDIPSARKKVIYTTAWNARAAITSLLYR